MQFNVLRNALEAVLWRNNSALTKTYILFRKPSLQANVGIFRCSLRGSTYILLFLPGYFIVSTHRWILGMASIVCVSVKICVSSISLYKLDPDKLTTPFESAHINLP